MSIVEVHDLTVSYNGEAALYNVSFNIAKPLFLCIIGPNGAGKTTLIKALIGILKPIKGYVKVLGLDPSRDVDVRRLIGYVPQRERINSSMPALVRDVVLMGCLSLVGPFRWFRKADMDSVLNAINIVGLRNLLNEPFSHLSVGQQQRVLIARALASNPKILMLDEPLSGVDATSQEIVISTIRRSVDNGVTAIMVTHDLNPVLDHIDALMLLNKTVIAYGSPREILREDLLVKTFLREVKILRIDNKHYVMGTDHHA
jgi:ABC-type Mn2+/Zn2+ transport system ATPase subunit